MSAPAIGLRPSWLSLSGGTTVDRQAPLASGIIGALVPALRRDLVTGQPLALAAAGQRETPLGMAGEPTAVSTPSFMVSLGSFPARMSFVAVCFKLSGTSQAMGLASFNNNQATEATGGFGVGYGSGASPFDGTSGLAGNTYAVIQHGVAWRTSTLTIPDGVVTVGGTRDTGGTALVPYVNGVGAASLTLSSTPTGSLWAIIGTGNVQRMAGAGRCPTVALFVWDRVLSADEMQRMNADPLQLLKS
jgi:hypothetical protein